MKFDKSVLIILDLEEIYLFIMKSDKSILRIFDLEEINS